MWVDERPCARSMVQAALTGAFSRMCGIVGLFLKDPTLEPELGRLTAGMLATLSDRGPDSAGFAVYGEGRSGETKLTLRAAVAGGDEGDGRSRIGSAFSDANVTLHDTHAVVAVDDAVAAEAAASGSPARRRTSTWSDAATAWSSTRKSAGRRQVAERFGLAAMTRHPRHRPHPHGDRSRR